MLNIVVGAGSACVTRSCCQSCWRSCSLGVDRLRARITIPLLSVFIIMGRRFPNAGGIAHFSEMAFGPLAYIITSFIFLGAVAFGLPAIALTWRLLHIGNSPCIPSILCGFACYCGCFITPYFYRIHRKNIDICCIGNNFISYNTYFYWFFMK